MAHRGASGDYPENTLPAFEAALADGADGIELDTHLTADGTLVVMRDHLLDRTTNAKGAVNQRTAAQLAQLDAGGWFDKRFRNTRIPELREVLARLGQRLVINVEINPTTYHPTNPQVEEQLSALINEHALVDSVVLSAFDHRSLFRIQKIDRRLQLAALYFEPPSLEQMNTIRKQLPSLRAFHLKAARLPTDDMARQWVDWAGELPVLLWAVNDVAKARNFIKHGVSGIFTDYPLRMIQNLPRAPADQGAKGTSPG